MRGDPGGLRGAHLVGWPAVTGVISLVILAGSFTRVVHARKVDTLHADFGQLGGIALQFV